MKSGYMWCIIGMTSHWKDVVRLYVRSKRFVADVIAVIPLEAACLMSADHPCHGKLISILKFNQMLKFYKVITCTYARGALQRGRAG